nr:MAG TPA: hypothetical protein [Caudoviricetes sp.]
MLSLRSMSVYLEDDRPIHRSILLKLDDTVDGIHVPCFKMIDRAIGLFLRIGRCEKPIDHEP